MEDLRWGFLSVENVEYDKQSDISSGYDNQSTEWPESIARRDGDTVILSLSPSPSGLPFAKKRECYLGTSWGLLWLT